MKEKVYYTFSEIIKITKISERTFRYRIKELKEVYKDRPELIFKKRHSWRIHYSLIEEFYHRF